jgi:hypothetical protein
MSKMTGGVLSGVVEGKYLFVGPILNDTSFISPTPIAICLGSPSM